MILKARFFCCFGLVLFMVGCSSKDKTHEEQPVEALYNQGMEALVKGDYSKAVDLLNEVERQHPYSVWATRSQIMSAFGSYQMRHYDHAIGTLESFLQLHPHHTYTPYAYYLQGMCTYEQMPTLDRDPQSLDMSLQIFGDLIRRFPETSYAKDARLKVTMLRDHGAARELDVARFYQRQGNTAAALLRLYHGLKLYQDTSQVPETLYRMVECYLALGLHQDAHRTASVLGHNYPGSVWYLKAHGLLKRTIGLQPKVPRPQALSTP